VRVGRANVDPRFAGLALEVFFFSSFTLLHNWRFGSGLEFAVSVLMAARNLCRK
jgi:hypothetical protein